MSELDFRMSDDEREMDIDSEEDDFGDDDQHGYDKSPGGSSTPNKPMTQAEKRAHHNMLERKRRDHIKDSFISLRDAVPSLQGEKSSRAQILKKAAEYIQFMRRKNSAHQHDIEDLKRQNHVLENQTKLASRALDRARVQGGPRGSNGSGTSPIDIKGTIGSSKRRSSDSDNSDGEFHMMSSPESATSSSKSNTSAPLPSNSTNGSGPKKLKVLHAAK